MRKLVIIVFIIISVLDLNSQVLDLSSLTEEELIIVIDEKIEHRDEELFPLLENIDTETDRYSFIETYILNTLEVLIKNGDLTFSSKLIEILLFNNLENEKTQELYNIVVDKKIDLKERIKAEELQEEKKRIEIENKIIETELEVEQEEVISNIIFNNIDLLETASGYTDSYHRIKYFNNFYFYPLVKKFYSSEVYDGYISRDSTINSYTGQGLDISLGFESKLFRFRTDITGSLTYDGLIYEELKQITGNINFSLGLTVIDLPIFLRGGFLYDQYLYDDDFSDMAITNLPSGSIGFGVLGFRFLDVLKLDTVWDFLLAPLYTKNLDYGFYNKVYLTLNLIRIGKQSIDIKGGFDSIYLSEEGLSEYSFTPRLGIGISSYE